MFCIFDSAKCASTLTHSLTLHALAMSDDDDDCQLFIQASVLTRFLSKFFFLPQTPTSSSTFLCVLCALCVQPSPTHIANSRNYLPPTTCYKIRPTFNSFSLFVLCFCCCPRFCLPCNLILRTCVRLFCLPGHTLY